MSKYKPLPSREELLLDFNYNPDTGLFTHARTKGRRAKEGRIAGTITRRGYVMLRRLDKCFTAHRVAWLIMTGNDPLDKIIDHIDQNTSNNTFSNLRLATDNTNQWNRNARGWHRKGNKYQACIRHFGKLLHIGTFATAEEAQNAYLHRAKELRGEYAFHTGTVIDTVVYDTRSMA